MANRDGWRVLSGCHNAPPDLLIISRVSAEEDGYDIRITDLSREWGEERSKDDIRTQASVSGCCIDPSEDDEQYGILLDKIRSALHCEPGTSMSMSREPETHGEVTLTLSAPLPAPLPHLVWTMTLLPLLPKTLGCDLVTPLLHRVSALQQQARLLIREICDKDRIISKITDRLETSGNDLTTVFPGVSNIKTNRKRSQREQLAAHVKGLGEFNVESVEEKQVPSSLESLSNDALNDIVGGLSTPRLSAKDARAGKWYSKLPLHPHSVINKAISPVDSPIVETDEMVGGNGVAVKDDVGIDSLEDMEDDFQRQATPPGLKSHDDKPQESNGLFVSQQSASAGHVSSNTIEDESTTDDDDDLDAAPKAATKVQPTVHIASPRSRERRSVHESGSSSSSAQASHDPATPSPKPRSRLGTVGGTKKEPTSQIKPAPRLGRFGGKVKGAAQSVKNSTPPPDKSTRQTPVLPSPSKPRLGIIGGKNAGQQNKAKLAPALKESMLTEVNGEASPPRSRATTKEASPALRETSQERADRKRDQLKRELDEKAKAPVKKKRKF